MNVTFTIHETRPSEISAKRLTQYISEFCKALGEHESVHLIDIREGSCVADAAIDAAAQKRVLENILNASYSKIELMLFEDSLSANISSDDGDINIDIAGQEVTTELLPREYGSFEGELLSIGGADETDHLLLRCPLRGKIKGRVSKDIAKKLAKHLHEWVVIKGFRQWSIVDGESKLLSFDVESFSKSEKVNESWDEFWSKAPLIDNTEDIIEQIHKERYED